jgi:acyl carrier protein
MMPQAYVVMERMPLSANGKVERGRLPEAGRERPEMEEEYVGPRSAMEEEVAGIWREVLGVEKVGMKDNFFDVGGHSLKMVEVQARIGKRVGREVTLIELFQYPTIEALTKYLEYKEATVIPLQSINERAAKQREALSRQRQIGKQRVRGNG